jgi:hypothetical protein
MDWMEQYPSATRMADRDQSGAIGHARVATVASADAANGLAVALADASGTAVVPARSVVTVQPTDIGRDVLIVFEEGDRSRPVIVGILQDRAVQASADVVVDGKRVTVTADDELTLKSGKASITLGADGRIVIKGMEIVSRARGTNKVRGSTVLIN